jgi:hypothetical protein
MEEAVTGQRIELSETGVLNLVGLLVSILEEAATPHRDQNLINRLSEEAFPEGLLALIQSQPVSDQH